MRIYRLGYVVKRSINFGLKDEQTRVQLFSEENLDIKKVEKIALTREAAIKNAANTGHPANLDFSDFSIKHMSYTRGSSRGAASTW